MPSFEQRVSFAIPDVARKALLPLPDLSRPNRVPEPTLHSVPRVGQVGRTDVGVRSAAVGRSGEAGPILVVWAANVPAGFGYFGQIDSMGRRDDLASLRVVTLKTRLAHDSQFASCHAELAQTVCVRDPILVGRMSVRAVPSTPSSCKPTRVQRPGQWRTAPVRRCFGRVVGVFMGACGLTRGSSPKGGARRWRIDPWKERWRW